MLAVVLAAGPLAGWHYGRWFDPGRLCGLDVAAAATLSIGTWLERVITPLVTAHVIGLRVGARAGAHEVRGKHHKIPENKTVIPLRRQRKGT